MYDCRFKKATYIPKNPSHIGENSMEGGFGCYVVSTNGNARGAKAKVKAKTKLLPFVVKPPISMCGFRFFKVLLFSIGVNFFTIGILIFWANFVTRILVIYF